MRKVAGNLLLMAGIALAGAGIVAILGARQIAYANARHELSLKHLFPPLQHPFWRGRWSARQT